MQCRDGINLKVCYKRDGNSHHEYIDKFSDHIMTLHNHRQFSESNGECVCVKSRGAGYYEVSSLNFNRRKVTQKN